VSKECSVAVRLHKEAVQQDENDNIILPFLSPCSAMWKRMIG